MHNWRILLNRQLFLYEFAFPPHLFPGPIPVNPGCESATFWNRYPEWKVFESAKRFRIVWTIESGCFQIRWRYKLRFSLYRLNIQHGHWTKCYCFSCRQLARLMAHALLTIVTKESWILGRIRIRVDGQIRFESGYVWMGKFDLNRDTSGWANSIWIGIRVGANIF